MVLNESVPPNITVLSIRIILDSRSNWKFAVLIYLSCIFFYVDVNHFFLKILVFKKVKSISAPSSLFYRMSWNFRLALTIMSYGWHNGFSPPNMMSVLSAFYIERTKILNLHSLICSSYPTPFFSNIFFL